MDRIFDRKDVDVLEDHLASPRIGAVRIRRIGVLVLCTSLLVLSLVPPARAASSVTATLVQTVNLFQLNPPSPDPSGIAYLPAQDRLLVADSEVEEMSIWAQVNLWKIHRDGTLDDTANIRPFTKEPTGLGFDPATGRLFISDDSARKIFIDLPGNDGKYGTSDDVRTSFSTIPFGNTDPEDVAFATSTGDLFTADGLGAEIYRISPGPNGTFEGAGDDVITHFDVSALGVQDAEGLGYHPDRNTLLVPDGRSSTTMIEVSLGGTLLTTIDISSAQSKHPEDVAVAPATSGGGNNLFMVARGVDNNSHPNENDGKMYEFSVNLPSMGNNPPVVNAGPDQSVQFPDAVSLNGSVTDDGKPTPPDLTSQWTKLSGPGTVAFGDATSPVTTATFSDPGTYVLRLTGNDSQLSTQDDVTVVSSPSGGGTTLNVPIAASSDDAEEAGGATKTMFLNSGDLEMVRDNGADQTVGLRFAGVAVPPGATITNAYVQFTTQATGATAVTSLTIKGEAADNPGTFTTTIGNISARATTSAVVGWSVPIWTSVGAAGQDQRTPNLATVVQQLVSRPGWTNGNAIVLIITGTGRRVAHTFDSGVPAVLHVEYQ
jgi:K319-like protein